MNDNVINIHKSKTADQLARLRKCKSLKYPYNTGEQTFSGVPCKRGGSWKTEAEADAEEREYKEKVTSDRKRYHDFMTKVNAFRRYEEKRSTGRYWKFNERRFRKWLAGVEKKEAKNGRKN